MNKDTKNLIMVGGLLAGGLYVASTMGGDGDGWGGGGGGGIPLLPGDTEDMAEGDTVINYILGGDETPTFDVFGNDTTKKGTAIELDPLGEPMTADPQALPVDTGFIYNFMKDSGFLLSGESEEDVGTLVAPSKKAVHAPLSTSHHQTPSIRFTPQGVHNNKVSTVSAAAKRAQQNQTTVWDRSKKSRSLSPGQLSIRQESESRGQTVVYD